MFSWCVAKPPDLSTVTPRIFIASEEVLPRLSFWVLAVFSASSFAREKSSSPSVSALSAVSFSSHYLEAMYADVSSAYNVAPAVDLVFTLAMIDSGKSPVKTINSRGANMEP